MRRLLWTWWTWAAAAVWLAVRDAWLWAAVAASVGLFAHLARSVEEPPQHGLDDDFAIASQTFLRTVTGVTGVDFIPGNTLTLLNNGDAFYPAMLHDVDAAKRSITIEAYIYWAGDIGVAFARSLATKARAGVLVKVLLDAVGSATIGKEILQILQGGGCHIAWYNPVSWRSLARINHRTHRKSLIVDGALAYTGGAGIADHWTGNAQDEDHWRDIQIRVQGPAAVPLQTGFALNWLKTTGELITGDLFFPPITPVGGQMAQTLMSSPAGGASAVRLIYYLAMGAARRSIYIASPYFVPDEMAMRTLIEARARGIDVRILMAGRGNDSWLARMNSTRLLGPLIAAGVKVFEYDRTMLHYKVMVVDGLWATIGTANFDNRSFAYNQESNVSTFDAALAGRLQAILLEDAASARHVDWTRWKARGRWHRLQEACAALLEEQV